MRGPYRVNKWCYTNGSTVTADQGIMSDFRDLEAQVAVVDDWLPLVSKCRRAKVLSLARSTVEVEHSVLSLRFPDGSRPTKEKSSYAFYL